MSFSESFIGALGSFQDAGNSHSALLLDGMIVEPQDEEKDLSSSRPRRRISEIT
jgi:hypothetical protein